MGELQSELEASYDLSQNGTRRNTSESLRESPLIGSCSTGSAKASARWGGFAKLAVGRGRSRATCEIVESKCAALTSRQRWSNLRGG